MKTDNIKAQIEQYETFHDYVTQKVEEYLGRSLDERCTFSFTQSDITVSETRYLHNIGDDWHSFSVPIEILS